MAESMPLAFLFIALFGIGFGGTIPLDPAIRAEYFGRTAFAKIQGIMSPLIMASSATGPILAGYLFDVSGSYRFSFLITALFPCCSAVFSFFLPKNRPRLA
jgi:MFS family permease